MVENATNPPLLSVVIIGLNEAQRIGRCIDSIKNATSAIAGTEIVYVDSGSLDETVSIALSKGVRVFQLGKTQPPGPSAGRYVGSLVTQGRFIMFVDGDSVVGGGWIDLAIKLMAQDPSVVMFSGKFRDSSGEAEAYLDNVEELGVVKTVYHISGSWAPIVSREALYLAGNWNPFVRCVEEADLAIRFRHYIPDSRMLQSDRFTVDTPKCSILNPRELVRRWKIGFVKGRGQIMRNAFANGYWRRCWRIAKPIVLAIAFLTGLIVAIVFKFWWQFLLLFFGGVFLRAVLTWKFVRLTSVFYSLLMGFCCLWELVTVPVRTASDYVCDFKEIKTSQGQAQQ
ncbi:glycosyltransferase [Candidatus Pacearchaeota archaeon]|nr:glycosyltransferase [Candidatus Pacearchaeota archaeon]